MHEEIQHFETPNDFGKISKGLWDQGFLIGALLMTFSLCFKVQKIGQSFSKTIVQTLPHTMK